MSHDLASFLGRIACAYQLETPWHALGTKVEPNGEPIDVPRMLKEASLADWNLQLEDLYLKDGIKVPRRKVVVRQPDRHMISIVSPNYTIVQNEEAFGVLQPACEKFGVTIETAGALSDGERVWMLAKLPDSIEPIPGDKIDGYFCVTSGHTGKTKYRARPTCTRVVCANTWAEAFSKGVDLFSFTHTKNAKEKLSAIEELITDMVDALEKSGKTFANMADKSMTLEETRIFIAEVLDVDEDDIDDLEIENPALNDKFEKMVELSQNGKGADLAPKSLWSAFNGITECVDHVLPARAKNSKGILAANRSALFGKNAKIKSKALVLAKQMVA